MHVIAQTEQEKDWVEQGHLSGFQVLREATAAYPSINSGLERM